MTSVMIVEDDLLTRIGLASMLKNNGAYDIVAEADNGRNALEIACQIHPEIIITDVQMPLMNGIELIREVKRAGIPSKFIILSSYKDYEYVREGILNGAEDYILKLDLNKTSLFSLLDRIANKIEQENKGTPGGSVKWSTPIDSREMELCIYNLVTAHYQDDEAVQEAFSSCGLDISNKNLICILASREMGINPSQFDLLTSTQILNLLSGLIKNYGNGYGCMIDLNIFCLIVSIRDDTEYLRINTNIEKIHDDLYNYIKNTTNVILNIRVSGLSDEYHQLSTFFFNNCSFENGHYVLCHNQDGSENADLIFSMELDLLVSVLRDNNMEEIGRAMDLLLSAIRKTDEVSIKSIYSTCCFLIYIVDSYFKGLSHMDNEWSRSNILLILNKSCHKLEDYFGFIESLKDMLLKFIESSSNQNSAVMRAEQYIRNNYNRDIPLEEISLHVGLTSSYFSRLFTQITGCSFVNSLKNIRIAQAKELLFTTKEKIQTIGEMVGYNNTYYFCRVFKKETGMSPARYRRSRCKPATLKK